NKLSSDKFSEYESLGSELSGTELLDSKLSSTELSGIESSDSESSSSQSSSKENNWMDELFEFKLNIYTLMLDAAHKPDAFKKTSQNRFYIGNAKSTMQNKSENSEVFEYWI
ncbi:20288_t:CDS:2, partial [Racocetra persica]